MSTAFPPMFSQVSPKGSDQIVTSSEFGQGAPLILWFRQDLRLADNPAVAAAAAAEVPVIPLFVLDDDTAASWRPGGASRWWLHHSLARLDASLRQRGSRLILRRGRADRIVEDLLAETGASRVIWSRCYEPAAIARDRQLKKRLTDGGVTAESVNAALLAEPWTVLTKAGEPYRVYTPFWRACRERVSPGPAHPAPDTFAAPADWPAGDALDDWALLPTRPDWSGGLQATWTPGEAGAMERLARFVDNALDRYRDDRNRPDRAATSGLSPHLHWGEIGPRQVWRAVHARIDAGALTGREAQAETFLKELVWREFSYHLLYHFPDLPDTPLDKRFAEFPWSQDDDHLAAWQRGRTGYPIVDAGMRQLYETGWMHNRVRMITASFLVKDLLLPWQVGEAWFWDTLVDADLANNAASWQWVAGCGADAAPYFRVFNPVLQGQKFDPSGDYVRRFVPEIAGLPNEVIHEPWRAAPEALAAAGVRLGETYPQPIIDHGAARRRALELFDRLKNRRIKSNGQSSLRIAS